MPRPRDPIGQVMIGLFLFLLIPNRATYAGSIGEDGVSMPVYGIELGCEDSRYPALAGPWILWCSHGLVDRVRSLETGEDFPLPMAHRSPGIGPNRVYIPGQHGGLIHLAPEGPIIDEDITYIHQNIVSPGTVSGDWVAVLTTDSLQAFPIRQRARRTFSVQPAEWYPPALSPPFVAWVENGDSNGEDIYWIDVEEEHMGQILSGGIGNQRHVVASNGHFAWVEPDGLVIFNIATEEHIRFSTVTGFNAAPTLWENIACWEERADTHIDIQCSNGLLIDRPGHQLHPSLYAEWLIFREGDHLFVHRLDTNRHFSPGSRQ